MPDTHADWIAAAHALKIDVRPLVAGARIEGAGAPSVQTINPMTSEPVATYWEAGPDLVRQAVMSARFAFHSGDWSRRPIAERAAMIEDWVDAIRASAATLALMDCLEMGMPIAQAVDDVHYSTELMIENARLALSLTTPTGLTAPGTLNLNMLEPVGVVAAVTPWNFPVNQVLARIVAPLLMGNSVVLKPSEIACASALRLGDLALEAGLPAAVLNIVTGTGAITGAALVRDPGVDRVGFTGSTSTGARIQTSAGASGTPKPMSMELGGKSPHVVCESFHDLEALAPVLARSVFWNAGQVCSAGSRLIVHESRADALLALLKSAALTYRAGDPLDPATRLGPIATSAQHRAVSDRLDRARAAGAVPILDGAGLGGLAIGPTIFDRVAPDAEIAREEIFGPVLAVSRFQTREEAIALANAPGFGLVATIWTRDLAEGHELARAIGAGSVSVNAAVGVGGEVSPALGLEPSGRSGFGPDYGHAGLMQYARLKLIGFNWK